MSNVSIKPKDFSKQATKISISVRGFELNAKKCNAVVLFRDNADQELSRQIIEIPEDVFAQWGTDDSVISNYVISNLELEKA